MSTTVVQPHKSSLGLDANLAVILIYIAMAVVGWIPYLGWIAWAVPLVFFFMEKNSGFVKFHAVQAMGIGILRAAFAIIFQIIIWAITPKDWYSTINYLSGNGWGVWVLLGTISTIIGVLITVLIVYVCITAWQWKQVELPIIGPMATKAAAKLDEFAAKQGFGQAPPSVPPANPPQQ